MADEQQQLFSKLAEPSNINLFSVTSNKTKQNVDIANGTTELYYYESILQQTIKVTCVYTDTGNSVENNGKYMSVIEGLPLVGQEKMKLVMTDNLDNKLDLALYVNKISPLNQDSRRSLISLDLVSKEYILNEQIRVKTRFNGKISDHIKYILTDNNCLNTKKNIDIEETLNNYNFIGNNKKPIYLCTWLSKRSVPNTQNAKGNTAGYFFFETSKGFQYKSIDKLFLSKPVKSLIYNDSPDSGGQNIPFGYGGKILEYDIDNTIDVVSKFEIGTYSTKIITFDPFNCYYKVEYPRAELTKENLKLAGKELPVLNDEFPNKHTRTSYMLIDTGTLPTGNTKEQISKSQEQNFDPNGILNQAAMRYNQLFTIKVRITIPGDFSLHAGDLIFVDNPELSSNTDKSKSEQFGGIYMISHLCHMISTTGTFTKLILVRDSYGKTGNPTV
jgi:hypothetical protein